MNSNMHKVKYSLSFLLIIQLLVRMFTVVYIQKIPCMDPEYLSLAIRLMNNAPTLINYSPSYAFLLYIINSRTSNLLLSSEIIFIFFSSLLTYFIYKTAEILFNEKTAYIAALFAIFLPNLTVCVAGYSHTVVVASCFELMSVYFFIKYLSLVERQYLTLFISILFAIICIYIRPENLLTILTINIMILYFKAGKVNEKNIIRFSIFFVQTLAIIFSALLHGIYVHEKSDSVYTGLFTDSEYSYMTFLHTYSLRYADVVSTEKAVEISSPVIGTPIDNQYSILKAIRHKPAQFIENIMYNFKQLLNVLGHPLALPIYFYFFIGLAFLGIKEYLNSLILVCGTIIIHVIPLLIFHVEIRYMQPMIIFILILTAFGFTYHHVLPKITLAIITFFTSSIYLSYLYLFKNSASLCGS